MKVEPRANGNSENIQSLSSRRQINHQLMLNRLFQLSTHKEKQCVLTDMTDVQNAKVRKLCSVIFLNL